MIFLLSNDHLFIKHCLKFFKQEKVQQLNTVKFNKTQNIAKSEDTIILDIANMDIDVLERAKCAAAAFSNRPEYKEAMQVLNLGFRGYGNKYMHQENLAQVIQTVKAGQVWLPPDILSTMIAQLPQSENSSATKPKKDFDLSIRESEVVRLVAKGLSNREISEKMDITVRTVKSHFTSIFNKTGFRDRLELALNFK